MTALHEEVLDEPTSRLLRNLGARREFAQFYLAGGTGLALQLGHRRSLDIDLFSERKWSPASLVTVLASFGSLIIDLQDEDSLVGQVAGVRTSLFYYPYRLLEATIATPFGVPLAGLLDIACMKLVAVSQRGSRKDFVDLYALGQRGIDPGKAFSALREKAAGIEHNPVHLARSLAYFAEAEAEPEPVMLIDYDWAMVKRYALEASRRLLKDVGLEL